MPRAADDHGNRVGRVRGEDWPVAAIDLALGVAVVGRDEQRPRAPRRPPGRCDRGTRRRISTARTVAAKSPVCPTMSAFAKLATMSASFPALDRPTTASATPARAHLRHEVVRRDAAATGPAARSSPSNGRFAPAVEEVGDVRVLLGLGDAELASARARLTSSARVCRTSSRGKAIRAGRSPFVLRHTWRAPRRAARADRVEPVEVGVDQGVASARAPRSGRKLKKTIASPSSMRTARARLTIEAGTTNSSVIAVARTAASMYGDGDRRACSPPPRR